MTGPTSKPFLKAVTNVKRVMTEAGCVSCHTNEKGEIKRFDQWINLASPEMSTVLRAPLPVSDQAEGGYGLALCRNRKVDQSFSRKGLIYGFGYAHQVMNLEDFPTQAWPKVWPPEGEPLTSFASINDPHYQKILKIIRDARNEQLSVPRIDMPGADIVGEGIHEGRARQIIPQPLPEKLPAVQAEVDLNGFVHLSWECSARTIGLVAELHRSTQKKFAPVEATKIADVERFDFCDQTPPAGKVYYAVVFVSDPAATCGTCKSGAVLDYQHTKAEVQGMEAGKRCPLSNFKPVRSDAVHTKAVEVPSTRPPLHITGIEVTPARGAVDLKWQPAGTPGLTTYDIYGKRDGAIEPQKLNIEPVHMRTFSDTVFHKGGKAEYTVVANAPRTAEAELLKSSWVSAEPLPVRMEPVFTLVSAGKSLKLQGGASFEDSTLVVPSGHAAMPEAPDMIAGAPFSFVMDILFDEPGQMPVVLSFGQHNGAGWFLQRFRGRWRFHMSKTSCDGGEVPVDKWLHIVGIYDGETATLFQDGKMVAEAAVPSPPAPSNQPFLLGQYTTKNEASYQFTGKIKNFALYERIINPEL